MSQKLEDLLNLALQTPEEVRKRTEDLNVGFDEAGRTWELIVKYHGSLDALEALNVKVEYLIAGYAILTVPEGLVEAVAELEEIEYVEKPKRYFYQVTDPVADSCIVQVAGRDLSLTGAGVLIAVLDSGIDYRLPEFRRPDGSTRIRFLWDQTLRPDAMEGSRERGDDGQAEGNQSRENQSSENPMGGEQTIIGLQEEGDVQQGLRRPPAGFTQGVEFDAGQINAALGAASLQQQFQLLPSVDTSGHGTAVTGIAAGYGGGRRNGLDSVPGMEDTAGSSYRGVAVEAELLIVKLGTPNEFSFPRTTEIMRGVTWALQKAQALKMPLVINLSFGNNYGAHDGSSLIERFLDNAAEIGRTVICVGSGNEGASDGHLAGSLERIGGGSVAGLPLGRPAASFFGPADV